MRGWLSGRTARPRPRVEQVHGRVGRTRARARHPECLPLRAGRGVLSGWRSRITLPEVGLAGSEWERRQVGGGVGEHPCRKPTQRCRRPKGRRVDPHPGVVGSDVSATVADIAASTIPVPSVAVMTWGFGPSPRSLIRTSRPLWRAVDREPKRPGILGSWTALLSRIASTTTCARCAELWFGSSTACPSTTSAVP